MWSESTCISTHVLATRGCSCRHTAARGHLGASPWREVSCAAVSGAPGSVAGEVGGRVFCFASAEPSPWFCGRSCVALPPPHPALPLYKVNKQYRSTLAIACNLIAFVLVASGKGREVRGGGREGELRALRCVEGGEGGGSILRKLKRGLLAYSRCRVI